MLGWLRLNIVSLHFLLHNLKNVEAIPATKKRDTVALVAAPERNTSLASRTSLRGSLRKITLHRDRPSDYENGKYTYDL